MSSEPAKANDKIIVHFRATGNAPILKQQKVKVKAAGQFITIIEFLRKVLKCNPSDALFLYCNSAFCPSPEESIADLYDCFGSDNTLVLNYCLTPAWG